MQMSYSKINATMFLATFILFNFSHAYNFTCDEELQV